MRSSDSYKQRFTPDELLSIYAHSIIGRQTVGKDRVTSEAFGKRKDTEIQTILRKVNNQSYQFTDYRQLLFLKNAKEPPREICIPTIRDVLVLTTLKNLLVDVFDNAYITPKPQTVVNGVNDSIRHEEYEYYLKLDIRHFYASINHEQLKRVLRRKIRKPQVLHLIDAAIKTPSSPMNSFKALERDRGIPEGLPISNILANAYLADLDSSNRTDSEIAYYRYVDDILILCQARHAAAVKQRIGKWLSRHNLELNEKSSEGTIPHSSIEYLGYVFQNNEILIRRQSIERVLNRMESLLKRVAHAKSGDTEALEFHLSLTVTGCIWQDEIKGNQKFGWVLYFSQATKVETFAQLDRVVDKICARLDIQLTKELPSFRRTYYEAKYRLSSTRYIPRYGSITPIKEKRRILSLLGISNLTKYDDEWVSRAFTHRMHTLCRKLDRDVGNPS